MTIVNNCGKISETKTTKVESDVEVFYTCGDQQTVAIHGSKKCEKSAVHGACEIDAKVQIGSLALKNIELVQKEKAAIFQYNACEFNATVEAVVLRNILEGCVIDEEIIYKLLIKRTSYQRLLIAIEYGKLCKRDLIDDFEHKLSDNFKTLVIILVTPPSEYIASEFHHIISADEKDYVSLVEILCSLNNCQINRIKSAYKKLYFLCFENNLFSDCSWDSFYQLLALLVLAKRSENEEVCLADVKKDVGDLINTCVCPKPTPYVESVFFYIFARRSYAHLREVFKVFLEIAQCPVQKLIKEKFSGNIADALLTMVYVIENRAEYYAKRLEECVAEWGTHDRKLMRIFVSRCEVDWKEIKVAYHKCKKNHLEDDIAVHDDSADCYRKALQYFAQNDH